MASRLSWVTMAPLFVLLVSAAVSASTAGAQNQAQTNAGRMLNVAGTFTVRHTEIGVVAVNQNKSSSPCLGWNSTNCIAPGDLYGGQWFLFVELQLNTVSKSTEVFVVSVQVDSVGPTLQPIEFTITNSTITGSTGDFMWNLGPSFDTPFAFTVAVTDG